MGTHFDSKLETTQRMLEAWVDDTDVTAARAAVNIDITATELDQRITKFRAR